MLPPPGDFSGAFFPLGTSFFSKRAAEQQDRLFRGKHPTEFSAKDPIRLWIIQIGLIILTTQLLAVGLRRLRQPQVIAEVLGGIVLGPTLMGRIPGFTENIFPAESRPFLALTANIGLVLFLFLVGLEIDTKVIKRNAKTSLIISVGGILLPFVLGAAVAIPLYNNFVDPEKATFGHFLLFIGVAFSITAFPVLCRILTELKLLDDLIGIVVLSAGVGNDIVGWVLLALTVALVNASTALTALYVLLASLGWTVFLLVPVKRLFKWFARWTGSIENGPTPLFMTATIILVFGSAFFTDIIGVHAIFGGFLAGLVIPHEGGLAITITEKLEDTVTIIFLPLYFTLSGLSTNLGLLDNGITWAYTILILVVAYIGKFVGGSVAARIAGFNWREAATIGTLLSCKGLVELIVLNVGLSAGILDTRIFSMFVLEALVLTFASTPVTLYLYPPHLRTKAAGVGDSFAGIGGEEAQAGVDGAVVETEKKSRFLVVLDRMEHIPPIMSITQLLTPPTPDIIIPTGRASSSVSRRSHSSSSAIVEATVNIEALRMVELTARTSDLMRSSAVEELIIRDSLLGIYHTFAELHDLRVVDRMAVAQLAEYHTKIADIAKESGSDLIILTWLPSLVHPSSAHAPGTTMVGGLSTTSMSQTSTPIATSTNPPAGQELGYSSVTHSRFVRRLFASASKDVALLVDFRPTLGSARKRGSKLHIMVPFFGGPDDRLALEFVVQLCQKAETTADIIRVIKTEHQEGEELLVGQPEKRQGLTLTEPIHQSISVFPDTIYDNTTAHTRLASETADNISWFRYTPQNSLGATPPNYTPEIACALSRIKFTTLRSSTPLRALALRAESLAAEHPRIMVMVGRTKRLAVESHNDELKTLLGDNPSASATLMRKTLGDVATHFMFSGTTAPLFVMQAALHGED